MSNISDFVEL